MRPLIAATAAGAVAFLILAHPAHASITAASLSGPGTVSGCPATLTFQGTITGTPGTQFTYSFNRFINGAQQIAGGGTMTMPNNGSVSVGDSFTVPSATSGANFDQIWVHNIPAQADVYSNVASFSVTCGPPPSNIPAPVNLTSTLDATLCGQHTMFCGLALSQGQLAFIWDWTGPGTLDGYKLYRVDKGHHNIVEQTSAGKDATGTFTFHGAPGRCFAVTAYKGASESAPSNTYCVAGGQSTQAKSATLQAIHIRGTGRHKWGRTGVFGGTHYESPDCPPANPLCVGFEYTTEINDLGDNYANWYWRAGMMFDVASLSPSQIYKAVLHVHIKDSQMIVPEQGGLHKGGASWVHTSAKCWDSLGMATTAWWSGGQIDGNYSYYVFYGGSPGPDLAIDITTIAKAWSSGAPNFGVVIRGPDENVDVFSNPSRSCLALLDEHPTLELSYI